MPAEFLAIDAVVRAFLRQDRAYGLFPGLVGDGDRIIGGTGRLVLSVDARTKMWANSLPGGISEPPGKIYEVSLRCRECHASRLCRARQERQAAPVPVWSTSSAFASSSRRRRGRSPSR